MRKALLAILGIATLVSGCASAESPYVAPSPVADSRLLFDAYPGYPAATEIAYAGDWPSTDAVVQGREQIYYRETIYDIQGLRNYGRNLTYRRFRTERVGTAHR